MSIFTRLKDGGLVLGGISIMLGMMAISITLLWGLVIGMASISLWILKWTYPAFAITLFVSIVLLFPLTLIPSTRRFAAKGLDIASSVFMVILWLWGMAYTYSAWGFIGVLIGFVFLGIGIVPIAMLAALLHGDWGNLCSFLFAGVVIYVSHSLSQWLTVKVYERNIRLNSSATVIHQ
jgi:hypothetical protein